MTAKSQQHTLRILKNLINRFNQNPEVLGILLCGSATRPGEKAADLDLCLVVRQRPSGLEAAHFWLGDMPVDMNIRTPEDLTAGCVSGSPVLEDTLRRGEVLFECSPGALDGIVKRDNPDPPTAPLLDDHLKAQMRFCYAHLANKMEAHVDEDPLLCGLLLGAAAHSLLETYRILRGLPNLREKDLLKEMSARDTQLLSHLKELLGTGTLAERIAQFRSFADEVVAPVGGLWRRGEVVLMPQPGASEAAPGEWQRYVSALLDVKEEL